MRRRRLLGALLASGTAGCLQFESGTGTESGTDGAVTGAATDTGTDGNGSTDGSTATETATPDTASVTLTARWTEETSRIDRMAVLGRNVVVNGTIGGVRCLDVETGARRWAALDDRTDYIDRLHATGESIFVFAGGGEERTLYVLNAADGTIRGSVPYEFTPGDVPIVTESDVVFATFDNENDENRLYAVDRDGFEVRWTTTTEETQTGATGGVVADGTIHVGFNNTLRGFALSDGSLQYRSPLGVGIPVAFEDGLVAAKRSTFARIGLPSLSVDWELQREAVGIPERDGSRVFSRTWNGVFAVDAIDGTELWHHTIQESTSFSGLPSPSVQDGVLWVVGPDGVLYGYAADSGERVHEQGDGDVSGVEATDGGVVVRTEQGLAGYAIERE